MSAFKVGQRVKRISRYCFDIPVGSTGTISGYHHMPGCINVDWDNGSINLDFGQGVAIHTLAPLTDPKADEFIERMRNPMPLRAVPYLEPIRTLTPAELEQVKGY